MTKVFDDAEVNGETILKQLLLNLPADVLGEKIETTPLLEIFKKTRSAYRINAIGSDVMKWATRELHEMNDEVAGIGFAFEFVITQAYVRSNGARDWASLKRAIEDAITVKSG